MDKSRELAEPGRARQWIATGVVNLLALNYGMIVGWPSPVIPQLQDQDTPIGTEPITDAEISWLTGILCIAGLITTPFLSSLSERVGRKMTGFIIALPMAVCWSLKIFAYDSSYLLVARFFAGVGGAGIIFLVPLYVSEIASQNLRGTLSSLLVLILNFGILLAFVFGSYLDYHWFNIICLMVPVLFLGTFTFLPETPIYLVRRNRLDDATRSLLWLRGGNKYAAERELVLLQNEIKENESNNSASYAELFTDKATRVGLIISIGLMISQQLSGIFAVISYSTMIFKMAGSSFSPNMGSIIIGVIQIVGSYLSTLLIERLGRRSLLLISTIGTSICLSTLALYCFLQFKQYDMTIFNWIPVTSLSIYMIAYCLGVGPCPFIVSSEIFRRDIASLANSVSLLFLWLSSFTVVKFFGTMVYYFGIHGSFFFFSICCLGSFIFTLILIPETKGRPLEYIIAELAGNVQSYTRQNKVIDMENKDRLAMNPI